MGSDHFILDILDTAGQEDYAAMRDTYIRTGQGFLLVFSITSRGGFENLPSLHEKITQVHDTDQFPVVVVGNKVYSTSVCVCLCGSLCRVGFENLPSLHEKITHVHDPDQLPVVVGNKVCLLCMYVCLCRAGFENLPSLHEKITQVARRWAKRYTVYVYQTGFKNLTRRLASDSSHSGGGQYGP